MADVLGRGLTDLVLIGPKSVRLYAGNHTGWDRVRTISLPDGVRLPVPGANACRLVAFSDMTGSGQQHLVEVCSEGVRYWPNQGHGAFGAPVSLPGFSQPVATFNPDNLYLADVDGSGNTDLLYALSDRIMVYRNQSGNHFADPFSIMLPDGVRYDRTCSLQVADIQGLGVASLVLTVAYPFPRHWIIHFSDRKSWLLNTMHNNLGACHTLHYRSSVQFWLDEKAEIAGAGKILPVCHLPFPLHMLSCIEALDEITDNRLVSTVRYRHGAWDGREREFRGFGMVEVIDTDMQASQGTGNEISLPAVSRSWYATGIPAVDEALSADYWQGDNEAFPAFIPQFTTGHAEHEARYEPDADTAYWLCRGLKGLPLRSELYGLDDSSHQADTPYTVTENGLQVRLVTEQSEHQLHPVIWPSVAETRTYVYERVSSDPQCSQTITLFSDEYGRSLRTVSIHYPRRPEPEKSPYPYTLPGTLFTGSYDVQQQVLRLTLMQQSWHTLSDRMSGIWMTGLPGASRQDVFTQPGAGTPETGLNVGLLRQAPALLSGDRTFAGQQQHRYRDGINDVVPADQRPPFPPRIGFTETAALDDAITGQLKVDITEERLKTAGYIHTGYLFPADEEKNSSLWTTQHGHALYAQAEHFYLPVTYRDSLLTGALTFTRDAHDCVITEVRDAAGLTTTAEVDWRFLMPVHITDANDNTRSVTLDALGRVITTWFYGTENSKAVGYSNTAFTLPQTADAMLALAAPLPVHQCMVYVTDSWQHKDANRQPPHAVTLTTDRYDDDPEQQIRQQVVFSDGFGRVLQTAVRRTSGPAWQRKDNGSLKIPTEVRSEEANADFRWAVSGRTEYDNKGQPVRTYQPYFLNSWKYISDDSARQALYADTHYYDPIGREIQVTTAKNWKRRTIFTPWFVVSEDENDTQAGMADSISDNDMEKRRHD